MFSSVITAMKPAISRVQSTLCVYVCAREGGEREKERALCSLQMNFD